MKLTPSGRDDLTLCYEADIIIRLIMLSLLNIYM